MQPKDLIFSPKTSKNIPETFEQGQVNHPKGLGQGSHEVHGHDQEALHLRKWPRTVLSEGVSHPTSTSMDAKVAACG